MARQYCIRRPRGEARRRTVFASSDTASDSTQNAMPDHKPTAPTVPVYPPRRTARRGIVRLLAGASRRITLLAFCAAFFTHHGALFAAEQDARWQTVIAEHPAIPPYLIAVDKSRQELAFFERRSPLKLSRRFACTTGQAVGDKILEGDLKTPEGVYFVGYRIGSGLDFIKYGHEAYTLNYPNPVDRLRKKTGYGIWIHGRGEPLVPLQTEGCVSMNNNDLALLSKVLVPGAPVALTGSFVYEPVVGPEDAQAYLALRDKVDAWAKAWSDRSHDYFAFYDKESYGIAQGEPFSAFQNQKERLFKMLPWIRTTVRDVQVLRGPDYWVTWFYQDYQAPNLSTKGVRRLYWGKDKKGEFKILGMEWHPGLNTSTLLASADPLLPPLETHGPLWPGDLPGMSGKSAALAAAAPAQLPADAAAASPSNAPASTAAADGAGALLAAAKERRFADHVESPAHGSMAKPSPEAVRIGRELNRRAGEAELLEALRVDRDSSGKGTSPTASGDAHPAFSLPPPLPAQGIGSPAQPPVVSAESAPMTAAVQTPGVTTPAGAQTAKEPAGQPTGRTDGQDAGQDIRVADAALSQPREQLQEQPRETDAPVPPDATPAEAAPIAAEHKGAEWLGQDSGSAAAFTGVAAAAAPATPEFIAAWVEEWRTAWKAGNVDLYMAFYAPKAKQGSRNNAASIRKHKERIWASAAPERVELTDISVSVQGSNATAVMRQSYRDAQGKGDFGQKTLTFRNINGVWLITQEDWSPLPDEAGN